MRESRQAMLAFAEAINCAKARVCRELTWQISGQDGYVFPAAIGGFVIHLYQKYDLAMTRTRSALMSFCEPRGERDFYLPRLPTPGEGNVIRDAICARKRMCLSDVEIGRRAILSARCKSRILARQAAKLAA